MNISPTPDMTDKQKGFVELAVLGLIVSAVALFAGGLYLHGQMDKMHSDAASIAKAAAHQAAKDISGGYTEGIRAGTINTVGGIPYYLYGSGVGASDTTITLTYFKLQVTNQKLRMADFGTIGYLTLEPGNVLRQEFISFTGITQNTDGTATLTGVSRGMAPVTPFTASTTLQKTHAGGTQAIISNPPQLYELFANKSNDQTITGTWNFASTAAPRYDADPGAAYFTTAPGTVLINLAQLNRTASAGAANASETTSGLVELATGREAASSTSLGATGARLGLPASLATSSPWSQATTSVVMTQLDGRISSLFISTSSVYTFGGIVTAGILSTASSTINATTTLAANIAIGKGLVLNGVAYTAPSTQGTAKSVMVNDGSGILSWGNSPHYTSLGATGVSLSASAVAWATSTTVINVPAGVMGASSTIEISGTMNCNAGAGGANLCTVYAVRTSDGAPFGTLSFSAPASTREEMMWHITIAANNSASAQQTLGTCIAAQILGTIAAVNQGQCSTLTSSSLNTAAAFGVTIVLGVNANNANASFMSNVSYVVNP